jgi:predicted membrane-bound spermidine synthase
MMTDLLQPIHPARQTGEKEADTRVSTVLLLSSAVICGAAVMALELLGARMLSPIYGGSLTVWASMISVTMLSLACGYFTGGWAIDRWPKPVLLFLVLIASGLLGAVCPHMKFVLKTCYDSFGINGGALASSTIIFFLPLALLGTVSPAVIRLLSAGKKVGITAGGVYAISTLGSVAGTLGTGLWLIPEFGVPTGFRITALLLVASGALGLILLYKKRGLPSLLFLGLVLLVPSPQLRIGESYIAPDGERVTVIDARQSAHGRMVILEKGNYRLLVVGGIIQTGIPRNLNRLSKCDLLEEGYYQELLPFTVDDPEKCRALMIGLAGGMTAAMLKLYDIEVDAVDLDPEVIDMARKHFSFNGKAIAADGRRYLEDNKQKYDFCIIDTYSGDVFPFHLASLEAFRAAKKSLKPGGILALNFIGKPDGRPLGSTWLTMKQIFPFMRAIRGKPGNDVQTVTVFASDQTINFNGAWLDYKGNYGGPDSIGEAIDRLSFLPNISGALLLTDDYNPIDSLRASEALRWRQSTAEDIGKGAGF